MKSCMSLLLTLLVFVGVFGSAALIWYLSSTTEVTKKPVLVSPAR